MPEKNAREAVEQAISDSTDAKHISIQQFWMALYEYGYEVRPRAQRDGPVS